MDRRPTAAEIALPLAAFAVLFAAVVLGGPVASDPVMFRTHATAWAASILVLPALWLFLRDAGLRPLTQVWRVWWTAGWAMIAVHLFWGLGRMHDWDAGSVFERQGILIAAPIFVLEAVWLVDVILAWTRRDWAVASRSYLAWQWLAWWVAMLNFLVSLAVFQNDPMSTYLGALLVAALATALLARLAGGVRA